MALETATRRVTLDLETPFRISRDEGGPTREVVIVTVRDESGSVGVGAASPDAYYGQTPESTVAALDTLAGVLREVGDPGAHQRLARTWREAVGGSTAGAAARAAISVATHDLDARRHGEALYRRLGLDPAAAPRTCHSVGLAEPATMARRAAAAVDRGFDHLKVKLGTGADRARLTAVREAVPGARIRVDANGAWSPETALAHLDWLAEVGVDLIEQPVPAGDVAGLGRVAAASEVPVAADEACVTAADVPAIADAADAVVVKLMKCGGLRPALDQIATAHAHGLEVMLGCMVESNASIAAACHLAPLVEYADLDGSLLLAADPYEGVPLPGGRVALTDLREPGTGVREA